MESSHDSLGAFTLDRHARSLIRFDGVTPLRPKAWQVLMYLVQRPGLIVSGRELFDEVWAGVAVTPKTLTNVINELRRALADDPKVCIETRHRLGYRLVVGSSAAAPEQEAVAEPSEASIFVGRASELQMLERAWERACAGQRQVVLVSGFAGVGKTTLIERFAAERRRPPGGGAALSTRAACLDSRSDPEPYGPLAEALEGLVREADIVPLLQRCAPSWLVRMPWLLPAAEMAELRGSLVGMGLSRVLREGVQLLESIAAERPLLLVLEDLQHADAATLDLLAAIAQRDTPARLMLVASFRTHAGTQDVRESIRRLAEMARVTCLPVAGLPASEVRAYLEQRLIGAVPSEQLVAAVEAKSGGNALFLREMVDVLLQRRWLADEGSGWRLTVAPGELEGLIPDSARSLIGQHAEQLQAEDLELLEAASIVGEEFVDKMLGAACDRPLEWVAMACRRLAETGQFIRPTGQRLLPDGLPWSVYRFRHDLYRQGIADRVPPARRRACHERVAQALAHEYATCLGEVAPQLAMHYREAGDWERQLGALDVAAADAMARTASAEAVRYLEEAIEVGERWPLEISGPPIPAQLRLKAGLRAERHIVYGLLRSFLGGPDDLRAVEAFDRALDYVVTGESVVQWMRVQMGRCSTRNYSGRLAEALAIALAMTATAEAGHPELLALAAFYELQVRMRQGDFGGAVSAGRRMHGALPKASPDVPKHFDFRPLGESFIAFALCITGDNGAAANHRERALADVGARLGPYETVVILENVALAAVLGDDAETALAFAEKCHAHAVLHGFDGHCDLALAYSAWALCRLNRSSVAALETALGRRQQSTQLYRQSILLAYLAEVYLAQGAVELAAAAVARIMPEPEFEAEIERVRGAVLAASGQHELALECLTRARNLAAQQGAGLFERRTAAAIESLG